MGVGHTETMGMRWRWGTTTRTHRNCWKAPEVGRHQGEAPKPPQGAEGRATVEAITETVGMRWRLATTRTRHRNHGKVRRWGTGSTGLRNHRKALELGHHHQGKAPKPRQGAGAGAMGVGTPRPWACVEGWPPPGQGTETVGMRWSWGHGCGSHRNHGHALEVGHHHQDTPELLEGTGGRAPPGRGTEATARRWSWGRGGVLVGFGQLGKGIAYPGPESSASGCDCFAFHWPTARSTATVHLMHFKLIRKRKRLVFTLWVAFVHSVNTRYSVAHRLPL